MTGLPADLILLFSIVDTILFLSISYLYLHRGKPEHVMTEEEMRRRGWIIIALVVMLITSTIAVCLLLLGWSEKAPRLFRSPDTIE